MPLMEFYCIASQYYDTEVLDYFISRILVLLFKRRGKRLCFHLLLFQKSEKQQVLVYLCLYAEKFCCVEGPKERDSRSFLLPFVPRVLSISEQIQTHAFIFLCLMQRRSLLPKVKWQVDIWQRCITEALGLQQMIFSHQR